MNPQLAILIALAAASCVEAATFSEDFSADPATHGWKMHGHTNLFGWDALNQNLRVTWDSSQPDSYFYLLLGTILSRGDDFSLALDLQLQDIAAGVNPNKPSTFQLAFGFQDFDAAVKTNFSRGSSFDSPNLVEFDFFPDSGFGPTLWPSIWSTNSSLNYNGSGDYTILDLPVGVVMRIMMNYSASNQTLATGVTTNGMSIGAIHDVAISPSFTDFRVGTFAIESYSDAGQDPQYGGSILAHGTVDNIVIQTPPPPLRNITAAFRNGAFQVRFLSRTNWLYVLERAVDFQSWTPASASTSGNGANLILQDTNAPVAQAFYRVRAEKP
jgi:hypothetical protein